MESPWKWSKALKVSEEGNPVLCTCLIQHWHKWQVCEYSLFTVERTNASLDMFSIYCVLDCYKIALMWWCIVQLYKFIDVA